MLLSSGRLHLPFLLVDGQVEDLVEIRDSLQDPSLNNVEHDCILQLDSQLVSQRLLFSRPFLVVLENSGVTRDDVIKGNRVILVKQLNLNIVDLLRENGTLIFDLGHLGPHDVEECHWHLASCVHINLVFSNEGPVVDHTSSVESFNDKLDPIVHCCVNLNHSILNDLHDVRCFVDLKDL